VVLTLALLLIAAGILAIAQGLGLFRAVSRLVATTPEPTRVEERLIPTPTEAGKVTTTPTPWPTWTREVASRPSDTPLPPTSSASAVPSHTSASPGPPDPKPTRATATGIPSPVPSRRAGQDLFSPRQRAGVVAPMYDIEEYDLERLGAGWYLPCPHEEKPVRSSEVECAQLVVVSGDTHWPDVNRLREIARRHPGRLWLVGNEPDVIWQGNATPQEYAQAYHEIYQTVKEADPTSQVAIGGISQVTPLRLRYLEAVLASYQEFYGQSMPVDVWNIHLAILREERGSWGVDIPPGLPDDTGILYEIQDNANVEVLKKQVFAFRRWMVGRGLGDRPLVVTEFSVLMPADYGFPFERVRSFMMAAADFLMTAEDDELGYPPDGNRLVQRWAWYSVADRVYSTGNLFDPDTGQITPLGQAFADYATGGR
jgi:hypothetical protein